MSKSSQKGSAHLILTIVIAVALVITVGYIAYSKIKSTDKQNIAAPAKDADVATKTKTFCAKYEKICFDHPESWQTVSAESSVVDGGGIDHDSITSPDGKLTIYIDSGISGLGGACDPPKYAQTSISNDRIPMLGDIKPEIAFANLLYTQITKRIIEDTTNKSFFAELGIDNSELSLVKNGKQEACTYKYNSVFPAKNVDLGPDSESEPGAIFHGLVSVSTIDPKSDTVNKTYDTFASAQAAFNTENYEEANKILASAHY